MRTENPPVPAPAAEDASPGVCPRDPRSRDPRFRDPRFRDPRFRDPHPREQDFVLHLRAYENSAVVARRLTRLALDVWRWQGDPDGPLTVVGELFANACRAAPGAPVRLRVAWTAEGVRLECHDPASRLPPAPSLPDDLSETGRGLFLVAALAIRHGTASAAPPASGKTLWAVLPHRDGA